MQIRSNLFNFKIASFNYRYKNFDIYVNKI